MPRLIAIIGSLTVALVGGHCAPSSDTDHESKLVDWQRARERMVREQVEERGVHDPRVIAAMLSVPRHEFVPLEQRQLAYTDRSLPIGSGQSIFSPYLVGLTTELLGLEPGDRVLDVGTGTGYHAAVLASCGLVVYTIEIRPQLCSTAARRLQALGFEAVQPRCGDGLAGWLDQAPFDGILVSFGVESVPDSLARQLAIGGRMVVPLGKAYYHGLRVVTRTVEGFEESFVMTVRVDEALDRGPRFDEALPGDGV